MTIRSSSIYSPRSRLVGALLSTLLLNACVAEMIDGDDPVEDTQGELRRTPSTPAMARRAASSSRST
jgi:hypothetical protein